MGGSAAEQQLEALELVFSALAHPARRQILLYIQFRGGTMGAGDIASRFSCSWPTTTRHLRVLEDAGLLAHHKKGRERIYSLRHFRFDVVTDWLAWFYPEKSEEGK